MLGKNRKKKSILARRKIFKKFAKCFITLELEGRRVFQSSLFSMFNNMSFLKLVYKLLLIPITVIISVLSIKESMNYTT